MASVYKVALELKSGEGRIHFVTEASILMVKNHFEYLSSKASARYTLVFILAIIIQQKISKWQYVSPIVLTLTVLHTLILYRAQHKINILRIDKCLFLLLHYCSVTKPDIKSI